MQVKDCRKLLILFCFLCGGWACFAQYTVRGGQGTPLRVVEDKMNRIEVWLVNGIEDVEISFTSESANHKWYRYQTQILTHEPVGGSIQQGTSSTISNVDEGYGYFVEQASVPTSLCVWVIDISKYMFNVNTLEVDPGFNPCDHVRLKGDIPIPALKYTTPSGTTLSVDRSFDISYNTLEWDEASLSFRRQVKEITVKDPYRTDLEAPLADTEFHLKGDAFARHFNQEKSASVAYQPVALQVHGDTTVTADPFTGMNDGGDNGLSAPVEITFRGIANEPIAAFYLWKIFRIDDESGSTEPFVRFPSDEVSYEFKEAGKYRAVLEVTDRTATCTDSTVVYEIDIADSWLDIPNAFAAGAPPGEYNEFRVAYKSIVKFKGWIFNRWGVQMFHWTDPSKGWDGKKGNKYVTPGVYFYVIEAEGSDGKKYKKSGDINVFRPKNMNDYERME